MKKAIKIMLVVTLICCLVACQKKEEPKTPAGILAADFEAKVKSGDYKDTQEIADAILTNDSIVFAALSAPVQPGYLNGFSKEITGFSQATMFGPAIGSIPFIGYVFEVDGDSDTFMNQLKESYDLRWNICTQADEMQCVSQENYVFFVMSPTSFEEE